MSKTLKEIMAETDCSEMPAGLGDTVTIGWVGSDGQMQHPRKYRLSECHIGNDHPDGYPFYMPLNEQTSDMLSQIAEQVRKGNKVENMRIIVASDGYHLDPETMI